MVAAHSETKGYDEFPEGKFRDRKPLSDYLAVTKTVCLIPVAVGLAVVRNVFAGHRRKRYQDVMAESVMGHCYKSSTLRQLRILTLVKPLRVELNNLIYRLVASGLPNYNKLFEGDGFNARWISEIPDRRKEDRVLLYIHGGGYALKMCQPQIQYICLLAKELLPYRISVLALDYSITPFYKYPTQRTEGLACIRALESQCDRIMLMGDSCGGNLALTMLLAEEQLKPGSVWGLILVSPWVNPGDQSPSMDSPHDILSKERLNEMTQNFVSQGQLSDALVSPAKADPTVWKRVLPRNTVVVWGADECLADQCADWVHAVGIENFFVEKNGTHDCILRGMSPEPSQYITRMLVQWNADTPTALEAKNLEWKPYSDKEVSRKGSESNTESDRSATSMKSTGSELHQGHTEAL